MVNAPKSCKKCEKNAQIMQKKCKNAKKCEKVQNVNVMQKWNQNSHRTTIPAFLSITTPAHQMQIVTERRSKLALNLQPAT
jgi:hypothetical protein